MRKPFIEGQATGTQKQEYNLKLYSCSNDFFVLNITYPPVNAAAKIPGK